MTEGADRAYHKQIEELKDELHRFKEEQMAVSSMKNLHAHSHTQEEKSKFEVSALKVSITNLKSENSQLKDYIQELEKELEERTSINQRK